MKTLPSLAVGKKNQTKQNKVLIRQCSRTQVFNAVSLIVFFELSAFRRRYMSLAMSFLIPFAFAEGPAEAVEFCGWETRIAPLGALDFLCCIWYPEKIIKIEHCRRRIRVQTRIRIPNLMGTLHCAEHVCIAQTWNRITTPYFCIGQESESISVSESVSGNINKPLATFLTTSSNK